jgi:hypothetical protein
LVPLSTPCRCSLCFVFDFGGFAFGGSDFGGFAFGGFAFLIVALLAFSLIGPRAAARACAFDDVALQAFFLGELSPSAALLCSSSCFLLFR